MTFYSYFDGKTQFSQIFLGFVFFFLGGGGKGGGPWTNYRVFHLCTELLFFTGGAWHFGGAGT